MSSINEAKYKVELTYEELRSLDGQVSDEAQKVIDAANLEHLFNFELPLTNKLIRKSIETGTFYYETVQISFCPVCKQQGDYIRYKSGFRKGQRNYSKPTYLSGYIFHPGFVHVQGHGDICHACETYYNVISSVRTYILAHDLPVEIVGDDNGKFKKDPIKVCYKCKQEIQESKMGREPVLIGNSTYPSICPSCGAKATLFGPSHQTTDKFVMRRVK